MHKMAEFRDMSSKRVLSKLHEIDIVVDQRGRYEPSMVAIYRSLREANAVPGGTYDVRVMGQARRTWMLIMPFIEYDSDRGKQIVFQMSSLIVDNTLLEEGKKAQTWCPRDMWKRPTPKKPPDYCEGA